MKERIKVLIVDEDASQIATLSRILLRNDQQRYMVVSATSLSTALDAARDFRPDCLLVSGDERATPGLPFVAEYRAQGGATPVIAIVRDATAWQERFAALGIASAIERERVDRDTLCEAIGHVSQTTVLKRTADESRLRENDVTTRLEAAYQRASFLMDAGKRFAATLDDDAAVDLVSGLAFPYLGDVCIIDLFEASVLYRRCITLDEGRYTERTERELAGIAPSIDAAEGVPAVLRTARPAFFDEASLASVARDDADIADLRRQGLQSLAIVPLLAGGKAIGTLAFGSSEASYYRDDRRAVVEEFAQRAAVAIANARVVESARIARDQAENARRRLSFLARVSSLFSRSLDFEATFLRLTKICVTSLADTAEVFLLDEGASVLRQVAVASANTETERTVRRLRQRRAPTLDDVAGPGRAAATGRSDVHDESLVDAIRRLQPDDRTMQLYREWGMTSSICVPFAIRGRVAGVLAIERDRSGRTFSSGDLSLVEDVARRCASYFENARLYEREHSIASTLQHSLLPLRLPEIAGTRLASRYVAGADGMDVGGDWYDVVPLSDGRIAITIGDVVGRGMLAAATMGQLRDILRAYAFEDFTPAHALGRLNAMLFRMSGDYFATAISLVYDPAAGEIVYARAGHPPPVVVRPSGAVDVLESGHGIPIGASPAAEFRDETIRFDPGSTLVLYTDGLIESRERSAGEGIDELARELRTAESDPELLVDRLLENLAPNAADDTALLVIRALAPGEDRRRTWIRPSLDEAGASRLRREATAHVREYAPAGSAIEDTVLVMGELLGNVARHAPGPMRLSVETLATQTIVELADRGPGFPASGDAPDPRHGDVLATSGRGLFISRAVSSDFTLRPRRGGGTLVRAVIPLAQHAAV